MARIANFSIETPSGGLPVNTPVASTAICDGDPEPIYSGAMSEDGRFALRLANCAPGGGLNVVIQAKGYQPRVFRMNVPDIGQSEAPHEADGIVINPLSLEPSTPPFPPAPGRDRVCSVNLTFQGLAISTQQYGPNQPWFEPALQTLTDPADRQAVYAQKHAAGDTHLIVEFLKAESIYDESGQPWQAAISPDFEANPQAFLALLEEIIVAGFVPLVVFDGDNGDNPVDGYPNALRQLPVLVSLLAGSVFGDLNAYVLYGRLWDGVFYGSSPANIQRFGQAFRALLPSGYLAIQHNSGHLPVGNGPADYAPGGLMVDYDVIVSECNGQDDTFWQVAARLLPPGTYVRPPDQPSDDDPHPPCYVATGNARGRYFTCVMEWSDDCGEYGWVRVSQAELPAYQARIVTRRAYARTAGYTCVG